MKKQTYKKSKNQIALLLALVLIFAMGASGVYASSVETVSRIDTGVVNIAISEYTLNDNGEEVPMVEDVRVLPGTTVDLIQYFTATGSDCYIRARVVVDGLKDGAAPIEDDNLHGIADGWMKIGEYYYYPTPVRTNETIVFFRGFSVPTEWGNEVNPSIVGDWEFTMTVVVDAVQVDNFFPDFESDTPWGDVVIKESIHKDGYDMNEFTPGADTEMSIVIDDQENMLIEPKDLFEGLKTMMPGDSLTDSVEINCRYHSKLYLTTESIEDIDLLQKIKLKIVLTRNGQEEVIHDDTLDATLNKELLGEFKKGDGGTLSFTVTMPAELDNEYSLRNGSVKWIFEAESCGDPPQTGDGTPIFLYVGMMVFSGLAILLVLIAPLFKNRKDKK